MSKPECEKREQERDDENRFEDRFPPVTGQSEGKERGHAEQKDTEGIKQVNGRHRSGYRVFSGFETRNSKPETRA
jgi:hypothetical protein